MSRGGANSTNSMAGGTEIFIQYLYQSFLSTAAGFWFKAISVPANPSPTVTTSVDATTPAALPACQTKLRVISLVTINQAAMEPAITPKIAVAKPINRYSRA